MTESITDLLAAQLADSETAWSIGSFGAIAEFMREPDEAVKVGSGTGTVSAITAKGGLRIAPHPELRPFASESLTTQSWSQRIALCLPQQTAPMNQRTELTELGPDDESLRDVDRGGILFDIGLGTLQVDACIRTSDPEVITALRRHTGKSVFATDSGAMGVVLHANPHRVFMSKLGRVEVFQPIPPADGKSPEGPHTHVLPKLLAHHRTHAATEPVPPGWIPCAHFYPPHPLRDGMGRNRPFQIDRHTKFQILLSRYGDPASVALKRRVIYLVMAGHGPIGTGISNDRPSRTSVRTTLRQLQASDTSSSSLAAWLSAYERSDLAQSDLAESADPMEAVH
ncbi:MAG: hypothetical protein WBQ24_18695 [Xanthobacteraceae bacterium]